MRGIALVILLVTLYVLTGSTIPLWILVGVSSLGIIADFIIGYSKGAK